MNHRTLRSAFLRHIEKDKNHHQELLGALQEFVSAEPGPDREGLRKALLAHIEEADERHAELLAALDAYIAKLD